MWAKAQCPQFYDSNGNLTSNPYWISCGGTSYTLSLQSPTNFGAYTIHWGDGTANTVGGSYTTPATITHTYTVTIDTFIVQIVTGGCTVQGVVVMEKPVNAGIQIPTGGPLASCAPKVLQFINSSTNVSQTTHFIWNFGDGTGNQYYNYLNAGATVNHLYAAGSVNCQTSIQLSAYNYCTYGVLTVDNYSPIKIYDRDQALIACPVKSRCFPDNNFTFKDSTIRNCLSSGNVNQRYEKWDFGNNFGTGHDSIINWQAWPPTFPVSVAYPAVGNYTVTLYDSSLCGIDTATVVVSIVHKPTSLITAATNTVCQNLPITFGNGSTSSVSYNWNFDVGAGWQTLPYGNETGIYNIAGNYTISLVAFLSGSNAYCSDTNSRIITVKPNPVSNFSFTPSYGCNNSTVAFTDLSTGIISGYNWNFGQGVTSSSVTPTPQTYTSVGTYTVSLITTSTSGCKDTMNQPFHVYPAPVANFSVNTSCTGYQTQFANSSTFSATDTIIQYNWDFGDGSPTNNSVNPTYSYTAANTYTVALNVVTAHCSSTKTVILVINQTPTTSFAASNYTVCPNTAISFTNQSVGASTYSWTFGSLGISNSINPVLVYTNSTQTVTTYPTILVAISAQGCKDSITQGITVNPAPVAQYITSYAPNCAPVLITFTNTTVGGNTYLWSFGDGTSYTHFDTTHLYTDTTTTVKTFSVSMITVNTYSCSDTSYSSYIVYPQAIYSFVPKIDSGCTPLLITFHTDSGAVSYLWSFGDGSLSAGSYIQTHSFIDFSTRDTTFHITLFTTNAYNCRDTTYGTVIVKPSPTSQFAPSVSSGCTPLPVSFSNTSTPGTSNQWYFGDSTTSTVVVPNHTYTNTGSTVINVPVSLVVTSVNGCKDSTATDITLYPAANYSFTVSKDTGCSIFDELFTTDTTSTILAHYSWSFGDSTSSNSNNPTHNYSTTSPLGQTFTVTMTATSQYNCVNSQTSTIFVYPRPTASFTLSNNIGCAPLVTTFSNTSHGALSGIWYLGDSPTDTSNLVSPLTHTYQNAGVTAQNFSASLVIKGAHGCKDSTSQVIIANPTPIFSYQILPDSGCSPLPVNFVLTPTNFSPGSVSYIWHFGDGATSSLANPPHTYVNVSSTTANYTVSLTATNSNGCSNTVDSTVTVFSVPIAGMTLAPSTLTPQTYPSATVDIINTSPMGLTYNWNLGDSTQLSTYVVAPHTYATWGTYPIKLIVNNGHCSDSIIQNIIIKPPIPIAKFTGGAIGCQPLPVTFTNTSVYATNYLWNFGDNNYGIQANPTHAYGTPGVFTVTLIASGAGGADTLAQSNIVTVYQKPFAHFSANPLLVYIPNEAVNFTNQSQYAVSYNWNFGDGGTSTETNPQHTYYIGGNYPVILIATSAYGCADTFNFSTIHALIASSVQVPNAFTPNPSGPSSNGVYDPTALNNFIFHPVLTGIVQYELSIYNRWGELLFDTTDQTVGWDGYYHDKMCQEDTYVYKIYAISVTSQIIQKTGSVTLFR